MKKYLVTYNIFSFWSVKIINYCVNWCFYFSKENKKISFLLLLLKLEPIMILSSSVIILYSALSLYSHHIPQITLNTLDPSLSQSSTLFPSCYLISRILKFSVVHPHFVSQPGYPSTLYKPYSVSSVYWIIHLTWSKTFSWYFPSEYS